MFGKSQKICLVYLFVPILNEIYFPIAREFGEVHVNAIFFYFNYIGRYQEMFA